MTDAVTSEVSASGEAGTWLTGSYKLLESGLVCVYLLYHQTLGTRKKVLVPVIFLEDDGGRRREPSKCRINDDTFVVDRWISEIASG